MIWLLRLSCLLFLLLVAHSPPDVVDAANDSAFNHEIIASVKSRRIVRVLHAAHVKTALGILSTTDRVIVIGRVAGSSDNEQWLQVRSRLGVGFIRYSDVRVLGDLRTVPVVLGNEPAPTLPFAEPVNDPVLFPILPTISAFTAEIYQRGAKAGNRADIFSKVGDCMTADRELFLGEFATNHYDLGKYSNLEGVITFYRNSRIGNTGQSSFEASSEAALTGFNVASVEDSTWTDPTICVSGETPLVCEYRRSKPALAIIMFGTNDVNALTETEFDFYLRLVVSDSIERGVIPLLMTFPGDPYRKEKSHQFNQIIFKVGTAYNVPVVNLWLALQALPNGGRNAGSMYLSRLYSTKATYFTPKNLLYGYTLRNLLTLQALDLVWREVIKSNWLHSSNR